MRRYKVYDPCMVRKCRWREGFPFDPGQSFQARLQRMRRLRPEYVVALPPLITAATGQKEKPRMGLLYARKCLCKIGRQSVWSNTSEKDLVTVPDDAI